MVRLFVSVALATLLMPGAETPGALSVASDPSGAAVYVDGRFVGHTPIDVQDLPAGDHRVRLVKDGYLENGRVVSVSAGKTGGLQVRGPDGWVDAPPVENSFVCNIGDMLERLTGGAYLSTPHRVRNASDVGRLSFPFFFDPSWDAVVPVPEGAAGARSVERWDGGDVLSWEGTYGEYLVGKVAKVFPHLAAAHLRDD